MYRFPLAWVTNRTFSIQVENALQGGATQYSYAVNDIAEGQFKYILYSVRYECRWITTTSPHSFSLHPLWNRQELATSQLITIEWPKAPFYGLVNFYEI